MTRTVENERIRLRANDLNGVAVGITVVGVAAPFLAAAVNVGRFTELILSGERLSFSEDTVRRQGS